MQRERFECWERSSRYCYLLFQCSPQANQGTIQGGVFDQTGGAIAGATVTVIDVARGVSRPLTTDGAGAYVAPNLIPGTFTVRAEAKGFQTVEHANVALEVGQTVRVDLILQPGAQTQTITVTWEAPTVNTSDATLGGEINQDQLISLPMNGRDFKNVVSMIPGITAIVGGGGDTWQANGTRAEDVGYLLDGLRADEAYTGQSLVNSNTPAGGAATLCRLTPSRKSIMRKTRRRKSVGSRAPL